MVSLNNVEEFKLSTSRERNVSMLIQLAILACAFNISSVTMTEEIMIVYTSKIEILVLNFLKNPSFFDMQ